MKTLRVLLVDDEKLARRGLTIRLQELENIEILDECQNGRQAIKAINELNPDLVFLDIQMPGINGFDVVKQLQGDNMPLIVFVTAFDHYAVDAFEIHALDYILKPIDDERLAQSIKLARERLESIQQHNQKPRLISLITQLSGKSQASILKMIDNDDVVGSYPTKIAIKDGETTTLVATQEIDWIDAAGDYMCVHANDITHIMRSTMKELERLLDPDIFQRIHRSTIVNITQVENLTNHANGEPVLTLRNKTQLKISRSRKNNIKNILSYSIYF